MQPAVPQQMIMGSYIKEGRLRVDHNFYFISPGICSVGDKMLGYMVFGQPKMAILFLCSVPTLVEEQTGPSL